MRSGAGPPCGSRPAARRAAGVQAGATGSRSLQTKARGRWQGRARQACAPRLSYPSFFRRCSDPRFEALAEGHRRFERSPVALIDLDDLSRASEYITQGEGHVDRFNAQAADISYPTGWGGETHQADLPGHDGMPARVGIFRAKLRGLEAGVHGRSALSEGVMLKICPS